MPRLHSGAAVDQPESTKLSAISEVVWQQPQETQLKDMCRNSTTNFERKNDVESQRLPTKKSYLKDPNPIRNHSWKTKLGDRQYKVQCPIDSKKQRPEIQRKENDMRNYDSGDDNISPPRITTSQIEKRLVRDENTNELYMPLSSLFVLKRKKEMLYVHLDFENGLTIDAFVESGAYVSAIAQKELDIIKQQAPSNILKIDDTPIFQSQVANGHLEKPIATATLKFDIRDYIFAEHFVVMKNVTGPVLGFHFMRHNSVVNDTTRGFILFPHLTMPVKSAAHKRMHKTPSCCHLR